MDNKKRKTNCLNCKYSFRNKEGTLECYKGNMTSVSNYNCKDYVIFLENKEDLYKMYKVVENLKKDEMKKLKILH